MSRSNPSQSVAADHLRDFLADLDLQVAGELRTDRMSRLLYSTDASIYQVLPHAVLIPNDAADIQAAVTLAAERGVAVLPRAAGSSLAGQAVGEALIIDCTRHLDQLLEVNREERWARVQPGLVLDHLNRGLAPYGLRFGPDPASSGRAAMGGIVGNNSTGAHSVVYGMTADHVLETRVVLTDGSEASFGPMDEAELGQAEKRYGLEGRLYREIRRMARDHAATIRAGTPQHWRRCGGYNLDRFIEGPSNRWPRDPRFNLAQLVCGSEGTLAAVTEIKLGLVPVPEATALVVVHFDELDTALAATPMLLEAEPSAIELFDDFGMELCRQHPRFGPMLERFTEGRPGAVLITEVSGANEREVRMRVDQLRDQTGRRRLGSTAALPFFSAEQQAAIWEVRKASLGLLMSLRGDHKPIPFIEDSAVDPQHLAAYVRRIRSGVEELGTRLALYGHASGGCIHIRPLIDTKTASEVDKLPRIASLAIELLGEYGGSWSSEHGDGRARSAFNERFFGRELYSLYREVKAHFDPANLFNPGNIVDAPADGQTNNLRFGAGYSTLPVLEHLDFADDGGFARAVEMCNGAGVCRKTAGGVMCPSFRVTRDEEHSTRGRANALRSVLAGDLPPEALTGPRMDEVMDLCIGCKACKSECPSAVDLAKIKTEHLAHRHAHRGVPLRDLVLGNISTLARLASGPQATLANALASSRPLRWLGDRFLGIGRQRPLLRFARQPFHTWLRRRDRADRAVRTGDAGTVILFVDTFHGFVDPQVAIAATEVLEAAGFEVVAAPYRCCGRPLISKGLVSDAREVARATLDHLAPQAERGFPILTLEPSCLSAIGDDYASLLPGDPRVERVAERCVSFESFIAERARAGELHLELAADSREVLLHGHCHQRALFGTEDALTALALPGHAVREVDSGCCGMAGSFGYEAEHAAISQEMAELALLPEVRKLGQTARIAAAGVSCRQQIEHGSGRNAQHPAEILREALVI